MAWRACYATAMPLRKGFSGGTIVAAALILCLSIGRPASAESGCPLLPGADVVVAGATAAGTLLAADGTEIVLAGLAFRQATDEAGESGAAVHLGDALSRLGTGTIRIAPEGAPDRYGRLHANAYLPDGRWLQAELVAAGLAVARPDGGTAPCMQKLLTAESAARMAEAGLWADSNFRVKRADDPSLFMRNGIYDLVEGRVVSVGYGSRMVFLDFGRNFRTDFTVMVPNALVPRLLDAGIAVDSLKGRAVRVRGVIEDSGGPAIRIADPLALEILDRAE